MMSAEWVAAISAAGTFIVIAASAGAAFFQLRHMRSSNQLVALNAMRDKLLSPEFVEARRWVRIEFTRLITDPAIRKRLLEPGGGPLEFYPATHVANYLETIGALVRRGIFDRDIVCDLFSPLVLANWNRLSVFIASRRAAIDEPALWENFEYLAVLSKQWQAQHPAGVYPPGLEHMSVPDLWPEALEVQTENVT